MLVLINFLSIIGLVYIFNYLGYEPISIFPFAFTIVNTIFLYREYQNKNFKKNYSVFVGICISLLTLAIALQFKTHFITCTWAIEASLIVYLWNKTKHQIFKTFFNLLFPLVISSQIFTWIQYLNQDDLTVIFNPVFLTSLLVIITMIFSLTILKKEAKEKSEVKFFENLFMITCYGIVYLSGLFELNYQISSAHSVVIFTFSFLYSIAFITLLLIGKKKLNFSEELNNTLILTLLFLFIIHISLSQIVNAIIDHEIDYGFYFIFIIYVLPFLYLILKIIPNSEFLRDKYRYWMISFTIILAVSFELYRIFIFSNNSNNGNFSELTEHFSILYLPIIWAILSCGFIFGGLRKNISELNKIGFCLLGITILKLYLYDV